MGARRAAATSTAAAITLAVLAPATPAIAVPLHVAATSAIEASPGARCTRRVIPSGGVDVGGTFFFSADDGVHGRELWRSDGTRAGTVLVKEIGRGTRNAAGPTHLVAADDRLFFLMDDGVHGRELWTSDGSSSGTVMVRDIGAGSGHRFGPGYPLAAGDAVFFSANDGEHGRELWTSDGTRAGTVMVKDIGPGANRRGPVVLAADGGTVYFSADDGQHGRELWRSDGTAAGTTLVADLTPGRAGTAIRAGAAVVGGSLFFEADDRDGGHNLWTSDGTRAGTTLVRHFDRVEDNPEDYGPAELTAVGDTLFFTADDGVHGPELWTSDGTETGTVMVADVASDNSYYSTHYGPTYIGPRSLTAVGDTVFTTIDDDVHGGELWRSDGSADGTALVEDVRPGPTASAPSDLTAVGDEVFFTATDGVHGREVWRSDGTKAGTALLRDVDPSANDFYSGPEWIAASGGRVFFAESDGVHGTELWRSDGTTTGTAQVRDIATDYRLDVLGLDDEHPRKPRIRLYTDATGTLRVEPVRGAPVKRSENVLAYGGATSISVDLTRAGLQQLRRSGSLRFTVRLTFVPCAGEGISEVRSFRITTR